MKITANLKDVEEAMKNFTTKIVEEGGDVDDTQVKYTLLLRDVNREYASGQRGSVYEIISDLNDTVGLDEYGLFIDFPVYTQPI